MKESLLHIDKETELYWRRRFFTCEEYRLSDKLGNNHTIQLIEGPTRMDDQLKDYLADELTPVTGRGFLRRVITENSLRMDVKQHVFGSDRLVISRHNNEISSYIAASLREYRGEIVYHLEGVIVEPRYQATGLAFHLLKRDLEETDADILAFHTQSVKMVRLGFRLASLERKLAVEVAEIIHTRNRKGAKDKGRYGNQSLYDDPLFANVAIKSLDWQKGDALICAGRVRGK
jgi:hypothetical protein